MPFPPKAMSETHSICITGCDRGLGQTLALSFAARGHRVFAGVLDPASQGNPVFEEAGITALQLDVCSLPSVTAFAEAVAGACDAVDVLVNNAARLGDIETNIDGPLDFEDILATLNTNAVGPLRVTQCLLPLLRRGRLKSIVNISSEAGSLGQAWREAWFGYGMSKAALNMGSVICQNHLKREGFQTVLMHPGYLRTYMHGQKNMKADLEPEAVAGFICEVALRQRQTPTDTVPYIDHQGAPLPW